MAIQKKDAAFERQYKHRTEIECGPYTETQAKILAETIASEEDLALRLDQIVADVAQHRNLDQTNRFIGHIIEDAEERIRQRCQDDGSDDSADEDHIDAGKVLGVG